MEKPMSNSTPEHQQTVCMLAAMASAHRAAQLATVPGTPGANPATSAANGAMADTFAEYCEAISQAPGGWVCLPYYGEGNGRRLFNVDSGSWGNPC